MARFISVCLIVALGIPQVTRGKCCCTVERRTDHLKPCCRAALERANKRLGCCRCCSSRVGLRPVPSHESGNRTADIGNDCECGRFRVLQPGWRLSPRRDFAEPSQPDCAAEFKAFELSAFDLSCDANRLRDTPCATGPPLRVWHCVWVI